MGFYLLGIVVFLLFLVFLSDLYKESRHQKFDNDDTYHRMRKELYHAEFGEELDYDELERLERDEDEVIEMKDRYVRDADDFIKAEIDLDEKELLERNQDVNNIQMAKSKTYRDEYAREYFDYQNLDIETKKEEDE